MDRILREKKIPLFTLESQRPVRECDFLGITLQYEMCYTNILQVLELSEIPLRATDRRESDPIVIGGGPCTYNPEPIAPFFDLFVTRLFPKDARAAVNGAGRAGWKSLGAYVRVQILVAAIS